MSRREYRFMKKLPNQSALAWRECSAAARVLWGTGADLAFNGGRAVRRSADPNSAPIGNQLSGGIRSFTGGSSPLDRKIRAALLACIATAAQAAPIDKALMKLDPEERAHQACIIKGLDKIVADKTLPGADRMKTGVLGTAKFIAGTRVTTVGGAVRAKHKWYRLSFDCTVTADQMKATAFTYKIGAEIPKETWEEIGLWD
jgi:hypothetical protein